jgi:hypothetical protein
MKIGWEPTSVSLGELIPISAASDLGLTSITITQTQNPLISLTNQFTLQSISAPDMVSIAGNLDLSSDTSLASFSFPVLASTGPNLRINNTALVNLVFPLLVTVGDSFDVHDNALLETISVPELVATTIGFFNAYNLPSLTSVSCPKLATCGQGFNVLNDPLLASISAPLLVDCGAYIQCFDNPALTSISFPVVVPPNGCTVDIHNCALPAASVNHVLARCVANAAFVSGVVNVSGGTNAAPTGQGILDKATLIGRGVTVNTN